MTDSFEDAWVSVEKAAFGRGRDRRRQEAYARAPEMMRRFKAMRDMQQGVNPNRPTPRRRPTRRSASSAPPAAPPRRRPTRRRATRRSAQSSPPPSPTETPPTTTLTPRLPTLIPIEEEEISPQIPDSLQYPESPTDLDVLDRQENDADFGLYNEPHVDIAYKNGEVKQMPLEDFRWADMTDIRDVETIFQSDEDGEMKLIFEAPKEKEIETPASEVIEPTEGVVEAVNEMKPLQSDMAGLPKKPNKNLANVIKPLMTEGIANAIGPAENRDKVIARMQRKKAKPTASKQPTPPSDAEEKKPVEGKTDPVAQAAKKRLKPKNRGKTGMTMADLNPKEETIDPSKKVEESIKPLTSQPNTSTEVPRLGSRPSREDVLEVIDLVGLGNKEAYTQLYGALGDLEDMGSDLLPQAADIIEEYKAMEKHRRKKRRDTQSSERKNAKTNLSKPLTDGKEKGKLTSDDLAARLLNRGKKD